MRKKNKKRFFIRFFIIPAAAVLIIYTRAFYFLHRSDEPVKSDVVVVFIGPTYDERLKEGQKLMRDGFAENLIIPALHWRFMLVNRKITRTGKYKKRRFHPEGYPRYYENTHKEALMAKKMMQEAGYKTALFVSAPYHMRRISIISAKVFKHPDYRLRFIGSRYIQQGSFPSIYSWPNIKQVLIEYSKITGFYLYQAYEKVKLKIE